ncbi:MAG: endonuclease/exonuclease/phosphatase family protein [Bacteroidota bacterium]
MPFYYGLKIKPGDSAKVQTKKRRVVEKLGLLREALNQHIDESRKNPTNAQTVKIATWNIREFGGNKYGGRTYEDLFYMAEIISKFDLIALQEVRKDLQEFKDLRRILGPSWHYVASDVTDGSAGNQERMVFLYNSDVVRFRHIAGELTLKENNKIRASFGERIKLENGVKLDLNGNPDLSGIYDAYTEKKNGRVRLKEDLEIPLPDNCRIEVPNGAFLTVKKGTHINRPEKGKAEVQIPDTIVEGENFGLRFPENTFDDSLRQFARTPFLISFQAGWLKINLCTVHIYYGSNELTNKLNQRVNEIKLLTEALANKAINEFNDDKESFMGVLGDFNIIGKAHSTMEALESNGFVVPDDIKSIPEGSNVKRDKFYDQIAFWNPKRRSDYATLDIIGANIFDFFKTVYTAADEPLYRAEGEARNGLKSRNNYSTWRTYKMSDHLPMWVELRTDFTNEYFEHIESENG